MTQDNTSHTAEAWTEVEYTALCKSPYLLTPLFVPKEAKCYLCRKDGTREEQRMIFLVFKPTSAADDAEWEDDPTPGELLVKPLGDDDEEIEPAKVIYLGQDIEDFIHVVHEDDKDIIFDIYWRHGTVALGRLGETDGELGVVDARWALGRVAGSHRHRHQRQDDVCLDLHCFLILPIYSVLPYIKKM